MAVVTTSRICRSPETGYLHLSSHGRSLLAGNGSAGGALDGEEQEKTQNFMGDVGNGVSVSLYFSMCLLTLSVKPEIMGYHIEYVDNFPKSIQLVVFGIYLVTSIAPLFISTIKRTYVLGILMSVSCLVTIVFFTQFLTSVWCFFAATMSLVIYWILRDEKRKYKSTPNY